MARSSLVSLRRPTLLALVLGTVAAMASTSHVDLRLVASTTIYWSFVPLLQLLIAWACIAPARGRVIPMTNAIDAFFTTSLPWSIWLIAFAGWSAAGPAVARSIDLPIVLAFIPLVWTPWLIYAFCREVLRDDMRPAIVRTLVHQAASWLLFVVYYGTAVAIWPRIIGWYERGAITL